MRGLVDIADDEWKSLRKATIDAGRHIQNIRQASRPALIAASVTGSVAQLSTNCAVSWVSDAGSARVAGGLLIAVPAFVKGIAAVRHESDRRVARIRREQDPITQEEFHRGRTAHKAAQYDIARRLPSQLDIAALDSTADALFTARRHLREMGFEADLVLVRQQGLDHVVALPCAAPTPAFMAGRSWSNAEVTASDRPYADIVEAQELRHGRIRFPVGESYWDLLVLSGSDVGLRMLSVADSAISRLLQDATLAKFGRTDDNPTPGEE